MQPPFVAATETTSRLVHPATFVDIYLEILVLYLCANLRLSILDFLDLFRNRISSKIVVGFGDLHSSYSITIF